ncbi:MAG: MOSC domain-containing protein [Aggregatilineales bacterium]
MDVISLNIGKRQAIKAKSGTTGIYKRPLSTSVIINEQGVEGDVIVDVEHHGGVDQAVYIYGMPDYEWWSAELKRDLQPGTFGENITISELESATLYVGDQLQLGTVILEVTTSRIPCVTLAERMQDAQFVKKFTNARRYGAYCRVLQAGQVQIGDAVSLIPYAGEKVGINELADAFMRGGLSQEQLHRLLSVPLAIRARIHHESKLNPDPKK